jgi:hypothetical protein
MAKDTNRFTSLIANEAAGLSQIGRRSAFQREPRLGQGFGWWSRHGVSACAAAEGLDTGVPWINTLIWNLGEGKIRQVSGKAGIDGDNSCIVTSKSHPTLHSRSRRRCIPKARLVNNSQPCDRRGIGHGQALFRRTICLLYRNDTLL